MSDIFPNVKLNTEAERELPITSPLLQLLLLKVETSFKSRNVVTATSTDSGQ